MFNLFNLRTVFIVFITLFLAGCGSETFSAGNGQGGEPSDDRTDKLTGSTGGESNNSVGGGETGGSNGETGGTGGSADGGTGGDSGGTGGTGGNGTCVPKTCEEVTYEMTNDFSKTQGDLNTACGAFDNGCGGMTFCSCDDAHVCGQSIADPYGDPRLDPLAQDPALCGGGCLEVFGNPIKQDICGGTDYRLFGCVGIDITSIETYIPDLTCTGHGIEAWCCQ